VAALVAVLSGLCPAGGRTRLVVGVPGDRTDDIVRGVAELGARGTDEMAFAHKEQYLRGRDPAELAALLAAGAAAVGVEDVPVHATELAGLRALLAQCVTGDVLGVMCHAERAAIDAWLRGQGATVDGPDEIRDKVLKAAGGS
jgi:cyanophycin synthetase